MRHAHYCGLHNQAFTSSCTLCVQEEEVVEVRRVASARLNTEVWSKVMKRLQAQAEAEQARLDALGPNHPDYWGL